MKPRCLMAKMTALAGLIALAGLCSTLQAESMQPVRQNCTISNGEQAGTLRLKTDGGDCQGDRHCGNSMSDIPMSRFTRISVSQLAQPAAQLTATLAAEAGTFTCTGTVVEGELNGKSVFTPDGLFVERMEKMGFSGYDSEKLMAYALLDVDSAWARSLKEIGVPGMTADNLIALHIFRVDPAYVRSLTSLGYAMPTADQLISLRVQGVNGDEVKQIRALGYEPTVDQLIQIRIFKITPDFIQRMQARGLKDLTIDKLVQIRIFKLAD
jgi:hypothetical protein